MDFTIPRYIQETRRCQTERPCDVPVKGFFKQLEVDTTIQQGVSGALALDNILRGCMGHEPGTTLHVCVSYSRLRLDIIQKTVVVRRQVFLHDSMTLFIEPMKEGQFLRVWVFRFIVTLPTSCNKTMRAPKRKKKHTVEASIKADSSSMSGDSDDSTNEIEEEQEQPRPGCSHYTKL
jgi:hypothetical protein